LGGVEEEIIACFKTGGGVPYEQFPRIHEVMAEDSGQFVLSTLDSHILPLVPAVRDRLWQRSHDHGGEAKTRDYLRRAGFAVIEAHQLAQDISNIWYVVRK
jgi:hypothetical protein